MRLGAVEAAKLHAAAIDHFDAAFAGHCLKSRLHRLLLQGLLLLHHLFHQLRHQAFGKLAFRQLRQDGFPDPLAFRFVAVRRCRRRRGAIVFGDSESQQLGDFARFRGDNAGAQNY